MKKSLRDIVLIGVVFCLLIVINLVQAYRHPTQLTPLFIAVQIGLFSCYLGWIGIGELRRIGKYRLVKSLQVAGFILIIAIFFSPSAVGRFIFIVLIGVMMLMAFAIAMWYRYINDRDI